MSHRKVRKHGELRGVSLKADISADGSATIRVPVLGRTLVAGRRDGGGFRITDLYSLAELGIVSKQKEIIPWVKKWAANQLVARALDH